MPNLFVLRNLYFIRSFGCGLWNWCRALIFPWFLSVVFRLVVFVCVIVMVSTCKIQGSITLWFLSKRFSLLKTIHPSFIRLAISAVSFGYPNLLVFRGILVLFLWVVGLFEIVFFCLRLSFSLAHLLPYYKYGSCKRHIIKDVLPKFLHPNLKFREYLC